MDVMLPAPGLPAHHPTRRDGALHADPCIIGAGSGGLSVAAGAVQTVASVVLIETHRLVRHIQRLLT